MNAKRLIFNVAQVLIGLFGFFLAAVASEMGTLPAMSTLIVSFTVFVGGVQCLRGGIGGKEFLAAAWTVQSIFFVATTLLTAVDIYQNVTSWESGAMTYVLCFSLFSIAMTFFNFKFNERS